MGKAKGSSCRECENKFFGKLGQRYCDNCRALGGGQAGAIKRSTYNLTYAELARLESITECEVCGSNHRMVIDHDHETNKVRGRLCHSCNVALGHARDDINILNGLVAYLKDRA